MTVQKTSDTNLTTWEQPTVRRLSTVSGSEAGTTRSHVEPGAFEYAGPAS